MKQKLDTRITGTAEQKLNKKLRQTTTKTDVTP